MSRPTRRRLWAARAFYVLCLCQVLSVAGLEMGLPFLPAYFAHLGVEGEAALLRWTGAAQAVSFVVSLLCTPLWGRLGDRIGRKRMLVRAHLGLALALVALSFARTPLEALLARIVHGALAGLSAAALALVSEGRRCSERMAWMQASITGGAMLGPLAGGLLLGLLTPSDLYLAGAVLSGVCAGVVGLVARETPRLVDRREISPPASTRVYLAPAVLAAWILLFRSLEDTVLPIYLQRMGGAHWALWVGVALTGSRLAAMLCSPLWGSLSARLGSGRALALSLAGAGILTSAQVFIPSLATLAAVRFLLGAWRGGLTPCLYALTAERSLPAWRGQAIAWTSSGARLGKTLGNLLAAPVVLMVGYSGLFLGMGAGLALLAPGLNLLLRKEVACASGCSTSTSSSGERLAS